MKYAGPKAFRAALEQRLRTDASAGDGPPDAALVSRLRKRVTFERFLARLFFVAPGEWVLKGGFALELRLAEVARTTKDIDVDWTSTNRDVVDFLLDAADADLGDHFVFEVERVEPPAGWESEGQRWWVMARVDGREFETVLLDIGLDPASALAPVELCLPAMLSFADLPTVKIPALPIERHLAEKVHAYTRRYGPDADTPSSRVKDLIDIALIAASLSVDGEQLRLALDSIFEARARQSLPAHLPVPPRDWGRPWRNQTVASIAGDDPDAGHAIAARLIDPALADRSFAGSWSPDQMLWTANPMQGNCS